MTNVVLLIAQPDHITATYTEGLGEAFPDLKVTLVDHHSKVDPYIGDADVLMTFGTMVTPRVFEMAKNLKWVQSLGAGVDGIADQPALGPEVLLTRIHGIHGAPLSETAITHMLALTRRIPEALVNQKHHRWQKFVLPLVDGKTAGIFGVGAIAEELAPKLKALGMKVVGIDVRLRQLPGFDEMVHTDDLLTAAAGLDYLIVLAPLTPETRGIVGAEVFAAIKPSSYLLNLGRGGVVDEGALVAALDAGEIAGAALDVFAEEPLPEDSPLWDRDDILITPHNAGLNDEYVHRALPIVMTNMRHFLAGETERMVNRVPR